MRGPEGVGPTDLPVEDVVDELRVALADPGLAVLVAPPGAGKTTVVPLRLLGEPWLGDGRIVVLEPRRLAARAAARRMADLLGEPVGETVGYRTRDERVVGAGTRIEVITEGILVRRLQRDPALEGTGLVVLDEVHERNLVTDLSLALAIDARCGLRSDLRLLAMSATVAAERFAEVLATGTADGSPVPIVRSDGRAHPVEVQHRAPGPRDRPDAHLARVVAGALADHPEGDVLVFLAGAGDIRRVHDRLDGGALGPDVDVHRLFGAQSAAEQDRALQPSPPGRRRVVLSTDVAESSLTVAGVRIVVDAGLVRIPRHDPATGMAGLRTEPASLASSDQRAGRAGRTGPGVAIRAWDPSDRTRRSRFATAEIATADLTGFALELAVWGTEPDELPLVESPPAGAWARAREVLVALGALDHGGRPTARGRAMAELPLHPRSAAMVVSAREQGLGWTAVVLAALLDERDVVIGRPGEVSADLGPRVDAVGRREGSKRRRGEGGGVVGETFDRRAVGAVRRRAEQLARRVGVRPGEVALDAVGRLVATAHPERIAQAAGAGYRLRGGGGGVVASTDPLGGSRYLAVARIEAGAGATGSAAIALAALLDDAEVADLVAADLVEDRSLVWDDARGAVRRRTVSRSGALVLAERDDPAPPGEETTAVLLDQVRASAGELLRWSSAARQLRDRIEFARRCEPDRWPDVAEASLLAELDTWLAPMLAGATDGRDVSMVDLRTALRQRLDHVAVRRLDDVAPTSFAAADGVAVPIDYATGEPRASVRVQRLFSLERHPAVHHGSVPVVLELLSPADRPIQVTADLPGFWAGTWREVRKEMAGRYPKHAWPDDPVATPPPLRRPRRSRR